MGARDRVQQSAQQSARRKECPIACHERWAPLASKSTRRGFSPPSAIEGRIALSLLIDRPDLKSIMTNTSQPTYPPKTADTISIRQRSGIWRVAVNGNFYGDYTRRYWAIEAAFEKADAIAADGGAATITIAMDGAQDALLYDTRAPTPRNARDKPTKAQWPKTRRWPPLVGESFAQRLLERRTDKAGNSEAWPLFIRG